MKKLNYWFVFGVVFCTLIRSPLASAGADEIVPKQFAKTMYLNELGRRNSAEKVIPRAAGHSTALANYFFRGTLEILPPEGFVHAVIDGGGAHLFSSFAAGIRNTTPDEAIGPGVITAVAGYRLRSGYHPSLSNDPPSVYAREGGFSYSVSAPIRITRLSSETAEPFTFDFSSDPIPAGVTDLYLQVVFNGTLGHEADRAVAVGISDLNEPQHLVFWNNTDYFLLDGMPRKPAEIENDPDVEDYGTIYPYSFTETIAFAATREELVSAPASFVIKDLPPARYARVIVLMPGGIGYWVRDHIFSTPFTSFPDQVLDDATWLFPFPGTVNQETDTGEWLNAPVYTVRGVTQHQMTYFLRDYPEFIYTPEAFPAPEENSLGPYPVTISEAAMGRQEQGGNRWSSRLCVPGAGT